MWGHSDALISPALQSSSESPAKITHPGFCGAIGADESFTTRIVTRKGRAFFVTACMRGTDIPADLGEIQAMLASAR